MFQLCCLSSYHLCWRAWFNKELHPYLYTERPTTYASNTGVRILVVWSWLSYVPVYLPQWSYTWGRCAPKFVRENRALLSVVDGGGRGRTTTPRGALLYNGAPTTNHWHSQIEKVPRIFFLNTMHILRLSSLVAHCVHHSCDSYVQRKLLQVLIKTSCVVCRRENWNWTYEVVFHKKPPRRLFSVRWDKVVYDRRLVFIAIRQCIVLLKMWLLTGSL